MVPEHLNGERSTARVEYWQGLSWERLRKKEGRDAIWFQVADQNSHGAQVAVEWVPGAVQF